MSVCSGCEGGGGWGGGGGGPVTVKYRRPFGGAVINSNRVHNYNRAVGRSAFR